MFEENRCWEVELVGATETGSGAGPATRGATSSCAYCLWRLEGAGSEVETCQSCNTRYHADCFAENGGCAVFGCSAWTARQLGQDAAVHATLQAPTVGAPPPLGPWRSHSFAEGGAVSVTFLKAGPTYLLGRSEQGKVFGVWRRDNAAGGPVASWPNEPSGWRQADTLFGHLEPTGARLTPWLEGFYDAAQLPDQQSTGVSDSVERRSAEAPPELSTEPMQYEVSDSPSAGWQFCTHCGSSIDAGDVFCGSCGDHLGNQGMP